MTLQSASVLQSKGEPMRTNMRNQVLTFSTILLSAAMVIPGVSFASTKRLNTPHPRNRANHHVAKAPAVAIENTKFGKILETGGGKTLYETSGHCTTSACLTIWPPLVVSSVPTFGKGVRTKLLGQVALKGGKHQLTYGGHRLFMFARDVKAHETNGQNIHSPWGLWNVLSATTGKPVTKAVASTYAKTTASSSW